METGLKNPFEGLHWCDGAHWGVADLYNENRAALLRALQSGEAFDTGWYGVRKEIESGRVYRPVAAPEGMVVHVEASCSDDFDTEGNGERTVTVEPYEDAEVLLERICEALDEAMVDARSDQRDNSGVILWSIYDATGAWVETYLQDNSFFASDCPPGDCYSRWGFQAEKVIPKPIRRQIEDGIYQGESPFKVGEYTVRSRELERED